MRYAEGTSVAIGRSRDEISRLLRGWGCIGIGWLDDFETGSVVLQFKWPREVAGEDVAILAAQMRIRIESEAEIRARYDRDRGKKRRPLSEQIDRRGEREHRVLALWVKAALNAVEEGIVPAEAIFLPWILRNDGRTVYDTVVPHFSQLEGLPEHRLIGKGRA